MARLIELNCPSLLVLRGWGSGLVTLDSKHMQPRSKSSVLASVEGSIMMPSFAERSWTLLVLASQIIRGDASLDPGSSSTFREARASKMLFSAENHFVRPTGQGRVSCIWYAASTHPKIEGPEHGAGFAHIRKPLSRPLCLIVCEAEVAA